MHENIQEDSVEQMEAGTRPEILAVALVALGIGVITRFFTRSSLWLDEALSVNIASLPLGEIAGALKQDGHPPLFYFLLHGWIDLFGTSDIAVRGLPAFFGVLTLPLIWFLGRRKGGPTLGWVAVAVVSVSPFAVRYSNEARMYSLVILLVVIGWLLVDDVVARNKVSLGRCMGLVIVGTALLYTHYWSLWLLIALGITSLWKVWRCSNSSDRKPWLVLLLSLVLSGLLYLPWLPTMLYQSANTGTPWASPSRPTAALSETLADYSGGNYGEQALVTALFFSALLLGAFGFVIDRRTSGIDLRTRPAFRGAAWVASLTFAVGCAVSYAAQSAYASRYSAVVFPLVAVVASAGLVCFQLRWVRFGVVAGFCGFLSLGAFWNVTYQRTQQKSAAEIVNAQAKAGDIVIFCPDQLGPAGVRVMANDLIFVSYPTYGDGKFVDWVDYEERNRNSDPVAFAGRVLSDAGTSRSIFLVVNDTYKTFEGKCAGLIDALASQRNPEVLLSADGSEYFEHVSLLRFAASS
ncbi:MAG: glycosyltransferase family 39 protein [Acidimicrobiales bacterium]